MKELKLLCSYEEWKNKGCEIRGISEATASLLELSLKFNRTSEEEEKYQTLLKESEEHTINDKYTNLTHQITDLYNDLKHTFDDEERWELYKRIGRKQCEIEVMKEKANKE